MRTLKHSLSFWILVAVLTAFWVTRPAVAADETMRSTVNLPVSTGAER